jgi:hypothetical protein
MSRIISVKYPFSLPVLHPRCLHNEAGLLLTRLPSFLRTVHQSGLSHCIDVLQLPNQTFCIRVCFRRSRPLMCATARLLGWRVRIPPRTWMLVSCVYCVLCRYRPLRWADHSFRGVQLGVCVVQNPRQRGGLIPIWAVAPQQITEWR